ncbi:MAG: phosphohistidine phosphatase SixA [Verrucomicrobia bacterium]|nr:phosphohistidine phosphatase SixA [Verrucomicrobiota bacterium]
MNLYLVRHGIAVDIGRNGVKSDADRMLSEDGIQKTGEAARGLRVLDCNPAFIIASPLVRAKETAEIMREILAPKAKLELNDGLVPGAVVEDVVACCSGRPGDIMIVGHMPDMAVIASQFITGSPDTDIVFKKAGACCIQFTASPAISTGALLWLIQPRVLRRLTD